MKGEELIDGLTFVYDMQLTIREIQLLLFVIKNGEVTAKEMADAIGSNVNTTYHISKRLQLKRLIVLTKRDSAGNASYKFNSSILGNSE